MWLTLAGPMSHYGVAAEVASQVAAAVAASSGLASTTCRLIGVGCPYKVEEPVILRATLVSFGASSSRLLEHQPCHWRQNPSHLEAEPSSFDATGQASHLPCGNGGGHV